MILLTATTDLISVITDAAVTVDAVASYMDISNAVPPVVQGDTSNRQLTAITTATTTTIVSAPGSNDIRNVKGFTIRNKHASTSVGVTVQFNANGTLYEIHKATLAAGDCLEFVEGVGFFQITAASKLSKMLYVTADVTNATTSFADITDLTCPIYSGRKYTFFCQLVHKTNATTTGAQFGINAGSPTYMRVTQDAVYTPAATASAIAAGVASAVDTAGAVETTGPGTTESIATVSGFVIPAADVTFAVRLKSEVAVAGGLVVLKGSWLHLRECDN